MPILFLSGFISWILTCKSEEMAVLALHAVFGIFIYFSSVKGSSQPQARVFLTFNGKKEDKHSNVMIEHFLLCLQFSN